MAAPAVAQELFHFGPWTGMTELAFGLQEQDSLALSGKSSLFDRRLSEQRLTLRNSLTVIDSKFLDLNYGFTLGLIQSRLTTGEEDGGGDGDLVAFDLTAIFLPISERRLTLLFSRSTNDTPVEFAGTRKLANESLGLTMEVGPTFFPGTVRLRQSAIESTADFGEFARGLDLRRRSFDYTGTNSWPRHQVQASLALEDLDDRVTPGFSHQSQNLTVSHNFEVLAPSLATLTSLLRYFDRGGALSSSSIYLDETLRLQHRKYLSSSYRYVGQRFKSFSGPASDSQRLLLGLHHSLYRSLETDLLVGRTHATSRGLATDLDEAALISTYKKTLPWHGRLTARLDSRYEVRDSLRGDSQEVVTEERHVARFGIPLRLERPEVILASVVVTDELKTTVYGEGIDYEIVVIADFAEITPLPGGAIRDGQTILVEYRVVAPAASTTSTLRSSFDMALDFGWVEPYWGLRRVDVELMEGAFDRLLDDQEDRFAGLRFRFSGRRVQLVSINELQRRDSRIQTFESWRLGESLAISPWRRWTLRLSFSRVATDFTIPVRETRISEGRVGLRWRPLPTLSLETWVNARVLEDTVADDQTFERFGLQGRWQFGKIAVLASVERWSRERTMDDLVLEQLDGTTASLRISRRFFPGRVAAPIRRPEPEPWPADLPGLWSQPGAQNDPEPPDQPGE